MLALGGVSALWIAVDVARHRQHMWIMNIVWPVSALFGTVFSVWLYRRYGRLAAHERVVAAMEQDETPPHKKDTPFPAMVAKGAMHCGSGCTLGDLCAEFLALAFPFLATWVGWKSVFPDTPEGKIYAVWVLDFAFAFCLGVAFQYFTIKPMRDLSVARGLVEAIKADTLSLVSWQVGMYGCMAVAQFVVLPRLWGTGVEPNEPAFWFVMQIAMLSGFCTAYPVNWWLIRAGVKEKM